MIILMVISVHFSVLMGSNALNFSIYDLQQSRRPHVLILCNKTFLKSCRHRLFILSLTKNNIPEVYCLSLLARKLNTYYGMPTCCSGIFKNIYITYHFCKDLLPHTVSLKKSPALYWYLAYLCDRPVRITYYGTK